MPARRPFYRSVSEVPTLIQSASTFASTPIFTYSLAGGWPTFNSIIRLCASLLAVLSAFSFALIAAITRDVIARRLLSTILLLVALLSLAAGVLDVISIIKTASECADQKCRSAVPDIVVASGNVCKCSVDGWFYFTVIIDCVLLVTAVVCLVVTLRPLVGARRRIVTE